MWTVQFKLTKPTSINLRSACESFVFVLPQNWLITIVPFMILLYIIHDSCITKYKYQRKCDLQPTESSELYKYYAILTVMSYYIKWPEKNRQFCISPQTWIHFAIVFKKARNREPTWEIRIIWRQTHHDF